MKTGTARSIALIGTTGYPVTVEVRIRPDSSALDPSDPFTAGLSETLVRARAAFANSGLDWPPGRIEVDSGSGISGYISVLTDLAIAVAIARAAGLIDPERDNLHVTFIGEIGLDGSIPPRRTVQPALAAAEAVGDHAAIIPAQNLSEAVSRMAVHGVTTLTQVLEFLSGTRSLPSKRPAHAPAPEMTDIADIAARHPARRAIEVAAAGGHHILITSGNPTDGLVLAARLPGLLPDLAGDNAISAGSIHALAGDRYFLDSAGRARRPFAVARPHASMADMVGTSTRPGTASLAHHGVLYLDDAPEFRSDVLHILRRPVDKGHIETVAGGSVKRLPAKVQLVMSMRACPQSHVLGRCDCTEAVKARYAERIPAQLRDRIAIRTGIGEPLIDPTGVAREPTADVALRVADARARAAARWHRHGDDLTNQDVPGPYLFSDRWRLSEYLEQRVLTAMTAGWFSLRPAENIIKVAWTIADLAGAETPTIEHVNEAIGLHTGHHAGGAA